MSAPDLTPAPVEAKLLLSPAEASRLTGIGLSQVYRFVRDGTWPPIRIGAKFLIPRRTLDRWIEAQCPDPTPIHTLRRA
jgi:excisionase family DNA binding protein